MPVFETFVSETIVIKMLGITLPGLCKRCFIVLIWSYMTNIWRSFGKAAVIIYWLLTLRVMSFQWNTSLIQQRDRTFDVINKWTQWTILAKLMYLLVLTYLSNKVPLLSESYKLLRKTISACAVNLLSRCKCEVSCSSRSGLRHFLRISNENYCSLTFIESPGGFPMDLRRFGV